ncbi:hypothetical protein IFM89_024349 [Coptis chinensis]|uniref:Ribosomal protein L34Ae n=1 Tax=Coptis chinensis TaxID=261450 RepID=A0A835IWW8_9MAGN|nr:hypothetical protein IFM89_024349 [Coptis chinensis]
MPCSKEPLITLFFNCPTSFHLLFLFFNFTSILLARFLCSLCPNGTSERANDGYQAVFLQDLWFFSEDFIKNEDDLVADDIIYDGEALLFSPKQTTKNNLVPTEEGSMSPEEPIFEDTVEVFVTEHYFPTHSPRTSRSVHSKDYLIEEHSGEDGDSLTGLPTDTDSTADDFHSPTQLDREHGSLTNDETSEDEHNNKGDDNNNNNNTMRPSISEDGKFLILEAEKLQSKAKGEEEIIGDIFTDGSTSKSSSEWRSSLNYRDSGTEDPFSSSSRRSCQNWESYAVYRKYDEEMMFFDRYSTQRLSEADSLSSIQVRPRSVSERIVHRISTMNNRTSSQFHRNPHEELEAAYVAQICLAWEALNWNYKNFKRFKASRQDGDPGCPGHIAQHFQHFQVLLQRFIENEPYEHGRRPEVYARMRKSAPKLLQVPEFIGSEDGYKNANPNTTISSNEFLRIMEDGIRTFMNFIKADREKHCQILKNLFKRNRRSRVDPILLHFMKKTNKKKKKKIKDLYRAGKCFRKKRLKKEDEMEIVMSLVDLKVVSRVLKVSGITDEQLRWCEEKMSKVKVVEGKIQRDSSPLFFPTH